LDDNSFWEFVILDREGQTNRTDKEEETVQLSTHDEELETIFFCLMSSDAVVPAVNSNRIEEDDDEDNDKEPAVVDGALETEEERRAALNKLSRVKKYSFNPMALKDLDVVGQAMLGPGLRETRMKQREERKKTNCTNPRSRCPLCKQGREAPRRPTSNGK
jgi:hypothetical protein